MRFDYIDLGDRSVYIADIDKDTLYTDIASNLIQSGARKVKDNFNLLDYVQVWSKLVMDRGNIECLYYDFLSLIYKALTISVSKEGWLNQLIGVLEDDNFQYRYERIIHQIIPERTITTYLSTLTNKHLRDNLGAYYGDEDNDNIHDVINKGLINLMLDYLMVNYEPQVLYNIDDKYWFRTLTKEQLSLPLSIYKKTYLIFKYKGEDVLIYLSAFKFLDGKGLSIRMYGYGNELLKRSLRDKGLIIEATTNDFSLIPKSKYENRIHLLTSFEYECNLNDYKYEDLLDKQRVGLLLYGPPGTGKTSYVYSLYEQVFKEEGYIFLNMGYQQYMNLSTCITPSIKALILVNDADSIETIGNRAKVLSRLETHIFDKTVTFFTVNNMEGMDEAMMRKGRLDYLLCFSKVMI